MPLKDPEKRNEYNRNYRRWWRRRKWLGAQERGLMIYMTWGLKISIQVPGQGKLLFNKNFHVTDKLAEITAIENHPLFGKNIISLAIDWVMGR
jgi:hypothetical protein